MYYTGKENGRNNTVWKLEIKQIDSNFLVDLKMFNPKLKVGEMEKNTQAYELAASDTFVEESESVAKNRLLGSLFK